MGHCRGRVRRLWPKERVPHDVPAPAQYPPDASRAAQASRITGEERRGCVGKGRHPWHAFGRRLIETEDVQVPGLIDGEAANLHAHSYGHEVPKLEKRVELALGRCPTRSEERRVGKECRSRWS